MIAVPVFSPEEVGMLKGILVLFAIGGSVVTISAAEAASRTRSAYCMQGATSPGLSNCTFTSMAQCRATASARRMSCIANPFYKGRRSGGTRR
jgi:hypothetical protein